MHIDSQIFGMREQVNPVAGLHALDPVKVVPSVDHIHASPVKVHRIEGGKMPIFPWRIRRIGIVVPFDRQIVYPNDL